jgi:hypothetical protein
VPVPHRGRDRRRVRGHQLGHRRADPGPAARLAFGLGAVLGLAILLVRRNVPESPRWQFIHGHNEKAEELVAGIEQEVEKETGQQLEEVTDSIKIRQRKSIGFGTIAHTAFKLYPKRTVLGLSLFIGQAFLYNAVFFTVFYGYLIGAVLMIAAGIAEWFIGSRRPASRSRTSPGR